MNKLHIWFPSSKIIDENINLNGNQFSPSQRLTSVPIPCLRRSHNFHHILFLGLSCTTKRFLPLFGTGNKLPRHCRVGRPGVGNEVFLTISGKIWKRICQVQLLWIGSGRRSYLWQNFAVNSQKFLNKFIYEVFSTLSIGRTQAFNKWIWVKHPTVNNEN